MTASTIIATPAPSLPSPLSHVATALVEAPADVAFAFLADPILLGGWSLGCMSTQATEVPGIYTGWSLFDGGQGYFEIVPDRDRLLIDYRIGSLDSREPRICARIVPGPVCGLPATSCYATLLAWRTAAMTPDRWARLCASHEAEIWLIKAQIETRRRAAEGR